MEQGTTSTTFSMVATDQLPKADHLSWSEINQWGKNTLIFSSPAILVLLTALQGGTDLHIAAGMAISAVIASLIDLLRKYSHGV